MIKFLGYVCLVIIGILLTGNCVFLVEQFQNAPPADEAFVPIFAITLPGILYYFIGILILTGEEYPPHNKPFKEAQ